MKIARYFVTYVLMLGMIFILAGHLAKLSGRGSHSALVEEGNGKIKEVQALQADLLNKFSLNLDVVAQMPAFDFRKLTRDDRRELQAKLAALLSRLQRVLEIDAQRNITIDRRPLLLGMRDAAQAMQKASENFEQLYGENFDPRRESHDLPLRSQNDAPDQEN